MPLDELKAKLDRLTPGKLRFVATMLESLSNTPKTLVDKPTWLATPDWVDYFATALSVHHGMTTYPLVQTFFEAVFWNACKSVGWGVPPRGQATRRFVDIHVTLPDGHKRRLSVKSTAAKKLSRETIHISKLTEAAWIQDARTAKTRRDKTLELFREYQRAVDSIIMLRAFMKNDMPYCYQLLEIPVSIFSPIQHLPVKMFERDAPILKCEVDGKAAATVSLDRSDAKITVRRILLSECTVHANFVLKQTEP